jgi:hypothetical protein
MESDLSSRMARVGLDKVVMVDPDARDRSICHAQILA